MAQLRAKRAASISIGFLCSVMLAGCQRTGNTSQPAVSYREARSIVDRHCVSCHSEHPSIPAFPIAPQGVELDTAEQMQRHAQRIKLRAVLDQTMPLLNKTGMTEQERGLLGRWIDDGAKLAAGGTESAVSLRW